MEVCAGEKGGKVGCEEKKSVVLLYDTDAHGAFGPLCEMLRWRPLGTELYL